MSRCCRMWTALVAQIALGGFAFAQTAERRTFALDAVELVKNNKEVNGEAQWSVVRDGYTYRFASAANMAEFERQPTRYEIQMGGGCGRMGPLSGEGRCDLFAVHDGKLNIFASPQCRAGFLRAPEKLIETDDPPVSGAEPARKRGAELIELAVKAHGGAQAIDGATSYRQTAATTSVHDGKESRSKHVLTLAFPDRAREESCWNDSCAIFVVAAGRGAGLTEREYDRPLAAAQVRALQRKADISLLAILRARRNPDFVAVAGGETALDGVKLERVAVSFNGVTRSLGIDPASGRVRTLTYTGRGGERDLIGTVVRTFVDYETVAGVTLPVSWTVSFDGGPPGEKPTRLDKIEVNAALDGKLFAVNAPE